MTKHGLFLRCTLLIGALGLISTSAGCQTNIGGQTLPSAYYLRDDIQFFPAGDEFLLSETVRAMEETRAQQAAWEADVARPDWQGQGIWQGGDAGRTFGPAQNY